MNAPNAKIVVLVRDDWVMSRWGDAIKWVFFFSSEIVHVFSFVSSVLFFFVFV
jgi:hypothetical protein